MRNGAEEIAVAPFAGAWIEILLRGKYKEAYGVAPFAGAWIEIFNQFRDCVSFAVAPFAGAWIEILLAKWIKTADASRSLRGSVD